MADPIWPRSLPQLPIEDSVTYRAWDNVVRTQMDAGTAKMRPRFTAVGDDVTLAILVTKAQADTLDAFYTTTLGYVLPFTWSHFRKPGFPSATYRFKSAPQYAPFGAGQWRADLELERLPGAITVVPGEGSQPLPATVPSAPSITSATAGDASITVAFSAPASDGGEPITSYTAIAAPGGATATGPASPLTITGLTNGTTYTVTVAATNAVGTGPASAASSPLVPAAPSVVPDAPTGVIATAGDASALVDGTAPVNTGGAPILEYRATSTPGGITATGTTLPVNVTGLTNGTAYTFTLAARNVVGWSAESAASAAVTPTASAPVTAFTHYRLVASETHGGPAQIATLNLRTSAGGTPLTGTVSASSESGASTTAANAFDGSASTFWQPATGESGPYLEIVLATAQTVSHFDITYPDTEAGYTDSSLRALSLIGSNNGTAWTPVANKTEIARASGGSTVNFTTASAPAATVPGAPTIGTATAGDGQASVPFTAPASDGGAAISGYRATSTPGGITATGTTSPITVPGLTNGTAYTFTVAAQNSVGYGAESAASNSVTPQATPADPGLATNGTFTTDTGWTKGTGWTISGGKATHAAGTAAALGQVYAFTTDTIYKVVYTIDSISGGNVRPRIVGSTTSNGALASTAGTHTTFIIAPAGTTKTLEFYADATTDCVIDNVDYFVAEVGPELSTDPGFDDAAKWQTIGAGWTISGGVATRTNTGGSSDTRQNATLPAGTYVAEMVISAITTSGVAMRVGSVFGASYYGTVSTRRELFTLTTSGTHFGIAGNSTFAGSVTSLSLKKLS